jgi:hypothetical protein
MIRKSLFWGLTVVLLAALVNLIIRGHRLEKHEAARLVEVVRESTPSPTRVLAPRDLEIVRSEMRLESQSRTDHHGIEIRNNGKVPYRGIQVSLEYLDSGGKVLVTKMRYITQVLAPGAELKLDDVRIDGLPVSTVSYRAAISYADIEVEPLSRN